MEKWGLVLCGGGAKGSYQMGALQAFEEYGLLEQVCGISGVSIGAINEVIISSLSAKEGVEIWKEINPFVVFDTDLSLIDGKEGTFSREGMRELMHKYINYSKVRNYPCTLYVTITKETRGKKKVVYETLNHKSNKDIQTLIEATSALPVIYEEVSYKGESYRDGGLLDNMPIKPLYDEGYRKFIIISLSTVTNVNCDKFPGADMYILQPYKNLGGLVSGTLNFSKREIQKNLRLGYIDGKRFINAFF